MARRISPGTMFSATVLIAMLCCSPARAQSGDGYLAFIEWCRGIGGTHVPGPGYGRCEPGSGASSSTYDPNSLGGRFDTWLRRQLSGEAARDARQQRAVALNNQANGMENWDEALALYRQAYDLWASPVIRLNLIGAMIRAGEAAIYSRYSGDEAATLDRVERLLNEAEALNGADLSSLDGHANVIGYLHRCRNLLAQARADFASAARNRVALGEASERIAAIAGELADTMETPATASQLTFGDPDGIAAPLAGFNSPPPLPPTSRGEVPRLTEVENSPGYEAWLRGMDAVMRRDWTLAAAWFGTAQLRDPENQALGRAVALSEWTRDFYRRQSARTIAVLQAPTEADLELILPSVRTSPPEAAPNLTPEERRHMDMAQRANSPAIEDLDFLMRDLTADRVAMVETLPFNERSRLADRGVTLAPSNDWTDQLAPEVRAMVSELRSAFPARRYGPPDPASSPQALLDTGVAELSHGFADYAIVRLLYGDLAGAATALGEAQQFSDGYSPAMILLQRWRGEHRTDELGLAPGPSSERR